MVKLYGKNMSRREVAAHTGALSQFGGVRLMSLGDGVERGIRMLEFRTGSGLRFTVLVDRAFDIGDCDYKGMAIGWNSPAGFRHPALHEYEGEGGLAWLRSFSGLLVTCGLDHILFMHEEAADHYGYAHRKSARHSIHGRISTIPGKLLSYGEHWEGDDCTLYCEGLVQQSTVFGEDLHLIRRIEVKLGGNDFTIKDRVVNHGFSRTPHMYLYHVNIGHPVLSAGSRYLAPVADVVWASHAGETYQKQNVGYQKFPGPQKAFQEQVWQHDMKSDADGLAPAAIINDSLGLGFLVESRKSELPCHFEWQNFTQGHYCIGIEPCTNHVLGKPFAKERSELIWLEHGEEKSYTTRFAVIDGAAEIKALEKRIHGVVVQPAGDYPETSGKFTPIKR